MLEKPNLADELIIGYLQHGYGLQIVKLEFLPLGNDASAWVYKAVADNHAAYFIKLKRRNKTPAGVFVPYHLHQAGIKEVVSAIPNRHNLLWTTIDNSTFIVYPFIDGQTGMEVGLSLDQWQELGRILKKIHTINLDLSIASSVPRESFTINQTWMTTIWTVQDLLVDSAFTDALEEELAAFWREHTDEITRIVNRTQELGRLVQAQSLPYVLCHADIHTANVLVDGVGQLHIVDWDGTLFAPKERDLMFVVGGRGADAPESESEHTFLSGYGNTNVNWLAMAYYRYEWVVQEIADFGERVFFTADIGLETKRDAVRGLKQLFLPGDVITAAYASETYLA